MDEEGDFTGGDLIKGGNQRFLYDSESYLNFGHPKKVGLAAVQNKDYIRDLDNEMIRQDVENSMRELTEQEKDEMSPDQVFRYEQIRQNIIDNYD